MTLINRIIKQIKEEELETVYLNERQAREIAAHAKKLNYWQPYSQDEILQFIRDGKFWILRVPVRIGKPPGPPCVSQLLPS